MRLRRILYLERRERGSTRAFSCAVRLAKDHAAELTLAGSTSRRRERVLTAAELLETPVRVSREDGAGIPWSEVGDHDLVVTVGPRRRKGPLRWDPVVRSLVRECRCPVWVIHPAQGPEVRVVLAAVDLASSDGRARGVLRAVTDLWGRSDADVHAVHCWSLMGESMLASRTRGGSRRGARQVRQAAERSRRRELEQLLADEGMSDVAGAVLRKAGVVPGIRDAAWRLEADVVVVGWTDRTWLGEVVLGHTAERLIGRVPASVLVVRSPGARAKRWSALDRPAAVGSRGSRPGADPPLRPRTSAARSVR